MTDTKITASHILIMHKDSDNSRSELTKEEALTLIKDLNVKISNDSSSFKSLASEHSDCASSSSGGFLGEFGKGVMVKPFEDAAFNLKVGEISEIVETNFGFHLILREK